MDWTRIAAADASWIRYDRYQTFSPEQEGPPVGRFNTEQLTFPAIDNLTTFNAVAPRFGIVYDLTGGVIWEEISSP